MALVRGVRGIGAVIRGWCVVLWYGGWCVMALVGVRGAGVGAVVWCVVFLEVTVNCWCLVKTSQ
ncbi:hypothetical protein BM1374166_01959 [Bartonella tribocorum]|nr:hypothetical protein BM1374166_01959 [Bartonella tribocorum]